MKPSPKRSSKQENKSHCKGIERRKPNANAATNEQANMHLVSTIIVIIKRHPLSAKARKATKPHSPSPSPPS